MATVTQTKWLLSGNSVSDSGDSLSLTEQVRLVFDVALSDAVDAIAFSNFQKGQPHRNKKFIFIDSISAEAETGREWLFTITYSTAPSPESEENENYEVDITPFPWSYQIVQEYDAETGDAFLNPAGDPLDPPMMREITSFGFRIVKRESQLLPTRYTQVGSLNNATIRIGGITCPKYCVQLSLYDPVPRADDKGYIYWLTTYDVKFSFKLNVSGTIIGHKVETLNAGFNYLDGGVKTKILILDDDGENVEPNEPQLLTAAGAKTTTASYTERCPQPLIDFSALNLPTEFPSRVKR